MDLCAYVLASEPQPCCGRTNLTTEGFQQPAHSPASLSSGVGFTALQGTWFLPLPCCLTPHSSRETLREACRTDGAWDIGCYYFSNI